MRYSHVVSSRPLQIKDHRINHRILATVEFSKNMVWKNVHDEMLKTVLFRMTDYSVAEDLSLLKISLRI